MNKLLTEPDLKYVWIQLEKTKKQSNDMMPLYIKWASK